MVVKMPKSTQTEGVYASLRVQLLDGSLIPGSKLRLAQFGTQYGVSLSVLREAMIDWREKGW